MAGWEPLCDQMPAPVEGKKAGLWDPEEKKGAVQRRGWRSRGSAEGRVKKERARAGRARSSGGLEGWQESYAAL